MPNLLKMIEDEVRPPRPGLLMLNNCLIWLLGCATTAGKPTRENCNALHALVMYRKFLRGVMPVDCSSKIRSTISALFSYLDNCLDIRELRYCGRKVDCLSTAVAITYAYFGLQKGRNLRDEILSKSPSEAIVRAMVHCTNRWEKRLAQGQH